MQGIIAEIGNHHFGNIHNAFALIRAAKDAGAHYVKMQAIDTMEFTGGSMPREFYRMCDLGMAGYMQCVDHARDVGIPIFFSVFGSKYLDLIEHYPDMPYKISGGQFRSMTVDELSYWNNQKHRPVVCSVPIVELEEMRQKKPAMTNMQLMFVSPYLDPKFSLGSISHVMSAFCRAVGYSDHTSGIDVCRQAIEQFDCTLIEKHFNIFGEQSFGGVTYRDSLHACGPKELRELVNIYGGHFDLSNLSRH